MSTGKFAIEFDPGMDSPDSLTLPAIIMPVNIYEDGTVEARNLTELSCQNVLKAQQKYLTIRLTNNEYVSWYERESCPYIIISERIAQKPNKSTSTPSTTRTLIPEKEFTQLYKLPEYGIGYEFKMSKVL